MLISILTLMAGLSSTYKNPVWPHDFPDPFVIQAGGKFYAFATQRDDSGFQCLESGDLVHWEPRPALFKPSWADEHYWAPEIHHYRGRWYLVYSAKNRTTHKHDVAIAVSPSPLGPYKELAKLVDGGSNEVGVIDATLFFERGLAYLLYSAETPRSIEIALLSEDLTHVIGSAHKLLEPTMAIEKGVTEAPTLLKRDGRYWLFYSTGWYASYKKDACYAVWAAASSSLLGPYEKPKNPLLATREGAVYSPGHQCVLDLPSGETWIFYHGWDDSAEPLYGQNHHGRSLRMDRIRWTASGPTTNGPTVTDQPAPTIAKE